MSGKTKTSASRPPVSAFSKLHRRQAEKLHATERQGATLIALSAHDHKAIAALIKRWLDAS